MDEISGTTVDLTGTEVSQGIDSFQEILEEMTEVPVSQDWDQGQAQIETKLDALAVQNMINLPRIVEAWK